MGIILLGFEPGELPDAHLARVKELAPDREVLVSHDLAEIEAVIDQVEIAAGSFPRSLLPKATQLCWIQQWGAGADWLMRSPEAVEMDFILTNASGVHAIPISEHIMTFLFAHARRLCAAARAQTRHEWMRPGRDDVTELAGKTMLLIGVGAIGERTARMASAVDMHVIGIRRDPAQPAEGVAEMYGPDRLLDLLPRADYVVLTVPLTHETKGMIGEAELHAMKPTAFIANIGRGGTIQEDALILALREGWIGGAGLDVFSKEPLPPESPLWDMENVIMTPHYSGRTPEYHNRAMAIFIDNLERYVSGQPMRNVVDKQLGY